MAAYIEMTSFLNKLSEKLLQEPNLFHDETKDQVYSLLSILKKLRPFVLEVQRKESAGILEELKMEEFIEIVNEADDAIDTYVAVILKDEDRETKAGDELRSKIEGIKLKLPIWHKHCLTCMASSSVVEENKSQSEFHSQLELDLDHKEEKDDNHNHWGWELIYNSLPHHLKPCLLYLGVFNSCSFTKFKELIIAEGLVEPPSSGTKEEGYYEDIIAENYVNELINRNLVEVVRKHWDGRIKEIVISKRMGLMDFCRLKAREVKFLEIAEFKNFPKEANRVALQGWYGNYDFQGISPMKARSFLMMEDSNNFPLERILFDENDWSCLLQNTSLKVLELDFGVYFTHTNIPSEIEKLIRLRYLRINYNGGDDVSLPQSISNLWNLQFLRLKRKDSWWFLSQIRLQKFWRMRQLKHLLCSDVLYLPQQPPEDGSSGGGRGGGLMLYNLQSLKYVSVECCNKNLLSSMPNLVILGVGGYIHREHIDEISNSLPLLKHLQKLVVRSDACGKSISLPRWDVFPPSITHLTFKGTLLVGDFMWILGKLPNLQVLKLAINAVHGDALDVVGRGGDDDDVWFPKLKCLRLENLKIHRWNLSVGAMPSLEILVIRWCSNLRGLPSEALQRIKTLRELEVYGYSSLSVQKDAEELRQKHIWKDPPLQFRFRFSFPYFIRQRAQRTIF